MFTKTAPLTDFELVNLLKIDDESAFRIIYERYWDKLYAIAVNRLKDPADAEEVVQDIFYNIWKKRKTLHLEKAFDNYFAVAVKFRVINRLAKLARANAYEKELASALSDVDDTTLEHLDYSELENRFEFTVNNLPDKCRLVFRLQHNSGYSHKQIAEELNISIKTVEAHLSKAKKTLRGVFGNFLGLLL
jgi:RNA polymerase sigma-70 factor (family 1)